MTDATPGPRGRDDSLLLDVSEVDVVYSAAVQALRGVDLRVAEGEIVAVLGANGAGKTTLLRAATGLLGFHGGRITSGTIAVNGSSIRKMSASGIVKRGVGQVMEGRRIFGVLTVEDNLRTGAVSVRDRATERRTLAEVLELFPVLGERLDQQAGYLSGGEQQMLAIGRALMSQPTLLVLDEPSLGLAPLIVDRIREVIVDINQRGTSVLLVEQNAAMALSIADRAYILENGRVARTGDAAVLRDDAEIRALYLGVGGDDSRRSYRAEFAAEVAARDAGDPT